ncbi:hypothetical protein L596_004968 [Steinernema carpocapsae]|uniref:MSP domain-containing protein n=1 Tax=Steinernema carpocapsae TaxID=34508 RepID=A0A4U8UXR1_STECR|nr:hypothetical protein L596_004968 [Steinernema carpocapsae]
MMNIKKSLIAWVEMDNFDRSGLNHYIRDVRTLRLANISEKPFAWIVNPSSANIEPRSHSHGVLQPFDIVSVTFLDPSHPGDHFTIEWTDVPMEAKHLQAKWLTDKEWCYINVFL